MNISYTRGERTFVYSKPLVKQMVPLCDLENSDPPLWEYELEKGIPSSR